MKPQAGGVGIPRVPATRDMRAALRGFLILVAVATLFCTGITANLAAQELRIAAASDLQAVLPTIATRFEHETGQRVRLTFGSSGNFATQLENGAPFDLFFSADVDYALRLEHAGIGERGSVYRYALGRIVLWTRNDSGIDVSRGLAAVADPRARHVAIANPLHAPYGRAAVAALQHERLYDNVRGKFVLGESVSQAAQFVQSGNAEAGIIALSVARAPALLAAGSYWEIPASFHPPIEQAAIVVATSPQKPAAHRFLAFMQRADNVSLMQDFGFTTFLHP
jgi:molybdate transport system substrate-binding protein